MASNQEAFPVSMHVKKEHTSGRAEIVAELHDLIPQSRQDPLPPPLLKHALGCKQDRIYLARKIVSFSDKGSRGVCVLSANGAVSNATIRQPGSSSGSIFTYEGRFEILMLAGCLTMNDIGGVKSRNGGLTVSLAGPDGRVIGDGVAGSLMAASPIQIVVGSFMPNDYMTHIRL